MRSGITGWLRYVLSPLSLPVIGIAAIAVTVAWALRRVGASLKAAWEELKFQWRKVW